MKIISRSPVGWEAVYDIGLAGDHNFLLANGVIAANCFNKSHATAYGYVTYQTAFLKANFPVEYMTALLTTNSGDQDKVERYIADCRSMGIKVLPPDVNRSEIDFTITTEGNETQILFGLSAVRNVGPGMIEAILQARAKGGAFQSLADFCERILEILDGRILNRRALESLIDCGAMNSLHPQGNRNQLRQDLPLVLEWAQARAKDRAVGQVNLFEMLAGGSGNESEPAPSAPPVADLTVAEKLRKEKELLGFYVSDHPLQEIHRLAAMIVPVTVSLADIEKTKSRGMIGVIALLTGLKPITTKRGERMAIVQLEDLTGQAEAVVFPKTYECIHGKLQPDQRLLLWGTLMIRDDRTQLLIEDAEPLEEVKLVLVNLPVEQAEDLQAQNHLSEVLKDKAKAMPKVLKDEEKAKHEEKAIPKVPVVVKVTDGSHTEYVRLGMQFWVCDAHCARDALTSAGFHAQVGELLKVIGEIEKQKQSVF